MRSITRKGKTHSFRFNQNRNIEKNHIVYTYEYHELRANQAKEEFERHGIDLKEEDKERTLLSYFIKKSSLDQEALDLLD